uniref:DRBM domain-containing protein n=1 Tax=Echinococcus granulosus TaxID=6210 RepID=A0A068WYG4_ECHGR|nr:hypothetical protein EgrG_002032700 [Echinococcus granulosus]
MDIPSKHKYTTWPSSIDTQCPYLLSKLRAENSMQFGTPFIRDKTNPANFYITVDSSKPARKPKATSTATGHATVALMHIVDQALSRNGLQNDSGCG